MSDEQLTKSILAFGTLISVIVWVVFLSIQIYNIRRWK